MGDNVILPATGSGDATPVISTEEVSTLNGASVTAQQVQRAAIVTIPSNGVADDVDAGNPLHVTAVVTTMPSNSSVNIAQVAGATVATGHGTASGAQRVELPTDGTGVIAGVTTVGTVSTVTAVTSVTNPVTVVQATATSLKAQAEVFQGGTAVGAAAPLQVSLANTASNATAVKVDGTGGSFPISGTAAVTQSTSPWVVAGSGTAGTANAGVVSVQGIASMTPVQVSQATASNLNATVSQATGTNLHTVVDSGTLTTVSTVTAVTSITNPVTVAQATATSLKAEVIGAGTAGTANAGVVTVQGITSMTPLLVTPAANSAVNVAQLAGTATSVNSGNKDAGTLRVTLATDQVALTNPLLITGSGTAGSAATGVQTIQGIASMTPVQVSQATASNLNVTVASKTTYQRQIFGSAQTVINTATDIAANAFSAAGTDFTNNDATIGNAPYAVAMLEAPDWAAAPVAGTVISLWGLLINVDGTDDDTDAPSGSASGGARYLGSWVIAAADALQRRTITISLLGIDSGFTPYIKNETAQNMNNDAGTSCVVKITPFTMAQVG